MTMGPCFWPPQKCVSFVTKESILDYIRTVLYFNALMNSNFKEQSLNSKEFKGICT